MEENLEIFFSLQILHKREQEGEDILESAGLLQKARTYKRHCRVRFRLPVHVCIVNRDQPSDQDFGRTSYVETFAGVFVEGFWACFKW